MEKEDQDVSVTKEWLSIYEKDDRIGAGRFCEVFKYTVKKGESSDMPDTIAVKVQSNFSMTNASQREIKISGMIRREIDILRKLKHRNLVELYNVTENKYQYYILMEICDVNLKQFLDQEKEKTEDDRYLMVAAFGTQILDALTYLHYKLIIHRDIKSANVLLKYTEPMTDPFRIDVKLCDFGLSRSMPKETTDITVCGTRGYMAPEVTIAIAEAVDKSKVTLKSDVFSTGLVLYEIKTNSLPQFKSHVTEKKWNLDFLITDIKDVRLQALLRKMLSWRPRDRPNASEVRYDQFFENILMNRTISTEENSEKFVETDDSPLARANCIATGSFENIHKLRYHDKARNPFPSDIVVVKEIALLDETGSTRNKDINSLAKSEIGILRMVHHPNLLMCFAIYSLTSKIKLVLEFCECTLTDALKEISQFKTNEVKYFGFQIIAGLSYLHSNNVVHGNAKSSNILVLKRDKYLEYWTLKLSDFGRSLCYLNGSSTETSCYKAPEIFSDRDANARYSEKADIFSVGVVVYEMSNREYPFTTDDLMEKNANMKKVEELPDIQFRNLLLQMCDFDQARRPTAMQVKENEFFKQQQFKEQEVLGSGNGQKISKMRLTYKKEDLLGKGNFGTVYLMSLIAKEEEGAQLRLTVMKKISLQPRRVYEIEEAVSKVTGLFPDKNIVNYLEYSNDKFHIYLFMEFCNGTLEKLMEERGWIGELGQVRPLAKQIASGFAFLHGQGIFHGDVKPSNILVKIPSDVLWPLAAIKEITVRISDFGFSEILDPHLRKTLSISGEESYMSPEMAEDVDVAPNFKSDVFSVGALFFKMRNGKAPFNTEQLLNKKEIDKLDLKEETSAAFKNLLEGMLEWELEERLEMIAVKDHFAMHKRAELYDGASRLKAMFNNFVSKDK